MEIIEVAELTKNQKEQIHIIWNKVYTAKITYQSIDELDNYLNRVSNHKHLLIINNATLMGWYFQFMREDETWFSLMLDPSMHGKGYGSKLLNIAKQSVDELNGWVIDKSNEPKLDGTIYQSPLEFYLKNDFTVIHDTRLEVEVISAIKIKWTRN